MKKNEFIGTWKLLSFELRSQDGQVIYPYGKDAVGYLIYNEDGYMATEIMSANRASFTSGDIRAASAEEKTAAFDTYLSYCSRYEIKGDKIIHYVEVSSFPNLTGVPQERFFDFNGDKLSIITPPYLVDGIQRTVHVAWERV